MKKDRYKKKAKKFFYKEDIFLSRMASVLKLPQNKVKELFYQKRLPTIILNGANKERLEKKDLILQEVEGFENTFFVKNQSEEFVKKLKEYKEGLIFVQNLAHLLPTYALNIKKGDLVLDMNPSSDTKHILFFNVNEEDLFLGQEQEILFDKVVLNAPSSREGEICFLKKRPLKSWNIKKTKALSKIQSKMLSKAFGYLKNGGLLVYTTTTISPNENEGVVSKFLSENKEAVLEKIGVPEAFSPFVTLGLKDWNKEVFHMDIHKTVRIVPGKKMLGTYVALIKKPVSY